MEEMTIDLKDLLHHVLKKWRAMIVWMLLLAIVFDGYGYYKKTKEAELSETLLAADDATLKDYKEQLKDAERAEVEAAVDNYISTQKELTHSKAYAKNSIRMEMDPMCVPAMTTQYEIDNHFEVVYPTIDKTNNISNIVTSYTSSLMTDDVCNRIAKAMDGTVDGKYVRELLSCYMEGNSILTIRVTARNEAECTKMIEVMETVVDEVTPEIQKLYNNFDIKKLESSYFVDNDNDLFSEQQSMRDTQNSLKNTLLTIGTDYTGAQKEYYTSLLEKKKKENNITAKTVGISSDEDAEEVEEKEEGPVSPIQLKYILIGMVAGVFLVCCFAGVTYICTSALRTTQDLTDAFQLMLIGQVSSDEQKKKRIFSGIDKWLDDIFASKGPKFTREEQLRMINSGIRVACDKAQMKTLFVTGSSNDEESQKLVSELVKAKYADVKVAKGNSIVYDAESLEQMAKADGVVFVERVGQSLYKDIERELELCKKYGVAVVGSIVVK